MRLLVTGRGSIARRHVHHLRDLCPDVDIAVISATGDVDPVFRPCTVLSGIAEGMAWQPDALVVASISSRHASELGKAIEYGVPCLVEKPLVTDRTQLHALCRMAEKNALPQALVVGCNLRYLPALAKLRQEFMRDPSFLVVRAHLEVGQELTQWRPGRDLKDSYSAFAAQGGGVVFDLVHEIDMARWFLGPLTLHAATGGHFSALPIESNDVHVALLKTGQGAPVVVSLDYVSRPPVRKYSFVTTAGTFIVDLMAKNIVLDTGKGRKIINDTAGDFDVTQTYLSQMAEWLAAMVNPDCKLTSSFADGLETAALMLDIYEAPA